MEYEIKEIIYRNVYCVNESEPKICDHSHRDCEFFDEETTETEK
jgi:hypothetical protein